MLIKFKWIKIWKAVEVLWATLSHRWVTHPHPSHQRRIRPTRRALAAGARKALLRRAQWGNRAPVKRDKIRILVNRWNTLKIRMAKMPKIFHLRPKATRRPNLTQDFKAHQRIKLSLNLDRVKMLRSRARLETNLLQKIHKVCNKKWKTTPAKDLWDSKNKKQTTPALRVWPKRTSNTT